MIASAAVTSKGLEVSGYCVQIDDILLLSNRRQVKAKALTLSPYYAEAITNTPRVLVDDGAVREYIRLEEIRAAIPGEGYQGYTGRGKPVTFHAVYSVYAAFLEELNEVAGRAEITFFDDTFCEWRRLWVDASRLSTR